MWIVYSIPGVGRLVMTAVLFPVKHDVVAFAASSVHTRQLVDSPELVQVRSNRFVCLKTTVKFDAGEGSFLDKERNILENTQLRQLTSFVYLVQEVNLAALVANAFAF